MYKYTQDYFSFREELWQAVLVPELANKPCKLLEIGCFEGRSAVWLIENVGQHALASITCIDTWEFGGEENFDHNIRMSGKYLNTYKHKASSHVILPQLERASFDFAYIDGSHDARDCLMDWCLVYPLMKPGGIVIFDDYAGNYSVPQENDKPVHVSPKPAIDLILDAWHDKLSLIHKVYQVIVRVL